MDEATRIPPARFPSYPHTLQPLNMSACSSIRLFLLPFNLATSHVALLATLAQSIAISERRGARGAEGGPRATPRTRGTPNHERAGWRGRRGEGRHVLSTFNPSTPIPIHTQSTPIRACKHAPLPFQAYPRLGHADQVHV